MPDEPITAEPNVLSADTVDLLLSLLDSVSISAADPKLVEKAQRIAQARDELQALAS